jgi:hypothetical protein
MRLGVLPLARGCSPRYDPSTPKTFAAARRLPGLRVIARSSSSDYHWTGQSPKQIGRELGVDYLLTATVRWEKNVSGQSRSV